MVMPSTLRLALEKAMHEVHCIQNLLSQSKKQEPSAGHTAIRDALRTCKTTACQTEQPREGQLHLQAAPTPKLRSFLTVQQSLDNDDLVQLSGLARINIRGQPSASPAEFDQKDDTGRLSTFSNFSNDLFFNREPETEAAWGGFTSSFTPATIPTGNSLKACDSMPPSSLLSWSSNITPADSALMTADSAPPCMEEEPLRMPLRSICDALNSCMPIPSTSPDGSKAHAVMQPARSESPTCSTRGSQNILAASNKPAAVQQSRRSMSNLPCARSRDQSILECNSSKGPRMAYGAWQSSFDESSGKTLAAGTSGRRPQKENAPALPPAAAVAAGSGSRAMLPLGRRSMPSDPTQHSTTTSSSKLPASSIADGAKKLANASLKALGGKAIRTSLIGTKAPGLSEASRASARYQRA